MEHNIRRSLEQYGLSAYILTGLKRKEITTVTELKNFLQNGEGFKERGILRVRGLGIAATRELMHKIPEMLEFCGSLESFDMDTVMNNELESY